MRKEKLESRCLNVEVDLMLGVGDGLRLGSWTLRFAESAKFRLVFRRIRNDMGGESPLASQCKRKISDATQCIRNTSK